MARRPVEPTVKVSAVMQSEKAHKGGWLYRFGGTARDERPIGAISYAV